MTLRTYRDLDVWKVSMQIVESVYRISATWPPDERFGIVQQIRRAAVSIPSNIAEGYGRSHRLEYLHHLSFARGSLTEAETQLILSKRLGFSKREELIELWNLMQRVGMMLNKQMQKLRTRIAHDRASRSNSSSRSYAHGNPEPEIRNPNTTSSEKSTIPQ